MSAYPGDLLLHLESFLALGRRVQTSTRGAFEQTAFGLHVDRSVLRRRLQALAAWVGVPLLRGRGAGLELTTAGRRLAERAQALVTAVHSLPSEVARTSERVTIACTGTVTTQLLPRVLLALERRERRVELLVRRAGGTSCEQLVRAGEADVGIVRATVAPPGFSSRHLADDSLWFVLPAMHPLARKKAAPTLREMASVPLVLYGATSRTRARVMERLAPLGAQLRIEVDGKSAALEYVQAGFGATFLSLLAGHAVHGPGTRARDVTALFEPSGFYVITRPDRRGDAVVQDVVSHLLRYAALTASRARRLGRP